jgi:hypothetical protein
MKFKVMQPLWKRVWQFLKMLGIELASDPAILLLGIYLREEKAHSHVRIYTWRLIIHVYNSLLFMIASVEMTPPKAPSTGSQIVLRSYSVEHCSVTERGEAVTWATAWVHLAK